MAVTLDSVYPDALRLVRFQGNQRIVRQPFQKKKRTVGLGTAAAEGIHLRLKNAEKLRWRQIILLSEMALLLIVGLLPQPLANALASFVCAMQGQTFHKVCGHAYASTMCIGNMRSGADAFCAYLRTREKIALQKALTYFGLILVFGVGAGLGSTLTAALGYRVIWSCCALLFISFGIMFVPEKK